MRKRAVTEGDLPILDRAALAIVEGLLPRTDLERNLALLIEACEDLRRRVRGAGHDAGRAAAAHMLAGSGGLLGFARLSAAARGYERAFEAGAVDAHAVILLRVLEETLPAMRRALQEGQGSALDPPRDSRPLEP